MCNGAPVNQPLSEERFDSIHSRMLDFWQGHDVYVQDCLSAPIPTTPCASA